MVIILLSHWLADGNEGLTWTYHCGMTIFEQFGNTARIVQRIKCLSWLKFKETRVEYWGIPFPVQNLEQTRSLDASRSLLQHGGHPIVSECSVYVGSLEVRRLELWYGDTSRHTWNSKNDVLKSEFKFNPSQVARELDPGSGVNLWNELKEDPNRKHVFSRKTWIFHDISLQISASFKSGNASHYISIVTPMIIPMLSCLTPPFHYRLRHPTSSQAAGHARVSAAAFAGLLAWEAKQLGKGV
jgi:hypothetical protein